MVDLNQQDSNLTSNGRGTDPLKERLLKLQEKLKSGELHNFEGPDVLLYEKDWDGEDSVSNQRKQGAEPGEKWKDIEEYKDFPGIKGIGTRQWASEKSLKEGKRAYNFGVKRSEIDREQDRGSFYRTHQSPSRQDRLKTGRREQRDLKQSLREEVESPNWNKAELYDISKSLQDLEYESRRLDDDLEKMRDTLSRINDKLAEIGAIFDKIKDENDK